MRDKAPKDQAKTHLQEHFWSREGKKYFQKMRDGIQAIKQLKKIQRELIAKERDYEENRPLLWRSG